jgi:hypothetical protein
MTITCYDFQSEDKVGQVFFKHNLNHIMAWNSQASFQRLHGGQCASQLVRRQDCLRVFSLITLVFYLFFSSFIYFLQCYSIVHVKIMTADEFAQLPNYNLADSIHNKWLQASNNKGDDLYVTTVDDCI